MPSFSCGSAFDKELKHSVIKGALQILDLPRDFKRKCKNRIRKTSTRRMSGIGADCRQLFDPARESEVAGGTNWRQIFPIDDPEIMAECANALEQSKAAPLGGVIETATTRKRKEAVIAQLSEREKKVTAKPAVSIVKPLNVVAEPRIVRPPKSVIIANENRAKRMKAGSQRVSVVAGGVWFDGLIVFDSEERDRMAILKDRSAQASALGMREYLRAMLKSGIILGETVERPIATTKTIITAAHSILGTPSEWLGKQNN
jgi:hypothetical protein